jgi:hypothetical protein
MTKTKTTLAFVVALLWVPAIMVPVTEAFILHRNLVADILSTALISIVIGYGGTLVVGAPLTSPCGQTGPGARAAGAAWARDTHVLSGATS